MGIPMAASTGELAAKAQTEHHAGRQRFIARIPLEVSRRKQEYAAEEWGAKIEAIENAGWVVDHFTVAAGTGSDDVAFVLFKRLSVG